MSLASSRVSMRHRCSIDRDQAAGDRWGAETTTDWQSLATDIPCRAWTNAGREATSPELSAVVVDRRVSVPLGTDVTERDRIGDVTDQAGAVIFEGPMAIEAVLRFADHLEIVLERVR